jgi:hypothetical protein
MYLSMLQIEPNGTNDLTAHPRGTIMKQWVGQALSPANLEGS